MTELLEIIGLTKRFGGLVAVNDVSFAVREREILSVIGPNGAGKSTLFKLISSFLRPTAGEVPLPGRAHFRPRAAHRGPQGRRAHVPGDDDLQGHERARQCHHRPSSALAARALLGFYLGTALARRDEAEFGRSADEILDFLGLRRSADEIASNLPHGHLRALGIAIGLATEPEVLLLDEPFAGMNHDETMQGGRNGARRARPRRHRPAGRARHAGGDEDLRPDRRPELRREDRRGNAGRRSSENDKVIEAYLGVEDEAIGL